MSKYKVGDRVKIFDYFAGDYSYLNSLATVRRILSNDSIIVRIDAYGEELYGDKYNGHTIPLKKNKETHKIGQNTKMTFKKGDKVLILNHEYSTHGRVGKINSNRMNFFGQYKVYIDKTHGWIYVYKNDLQKATKLNMVLK